MNNIDDYLIQTKHIIDINKYYKQIPKNIIKNMNKSDKKIKIIGNIHTNPTNLDYMTKSNDEFNKILHTDDKIITHIIDDKYPEQTSIDMIKYSDAAGATLSVPIDNDKKVINQSSINQLSINQPSINQMSETKPDNNNQYIRFKLRPILPSLKYGDQK